MPFDRRLTPARPDLAAAHLRGQVEADEFVEGVRVSIRTGLADLRPEPAPDVSIDTQALYGETALLYEDREGFGWVQLERDGYVGYLSMAEIGAAGNAASHRVKVNRSFIYPAPNMKLPPIGALPLGARVGVVEAGDSFARLGEGGFVFAAHLSPIEEKESDFVAVAEKLLHTPYLWGGKSSLGLDCSGLVQIALDAAGVKSPRDTDLQEKALGHALPINEDLSGLRRGDLVFWRGHVGIMRDAETLLHANAHHMMVASETLRHARDRILAKAGPPISSIRRLFPAV
ncbi:NLP/P60 protein [Methylocella silvestris BL2]|uniref:NLP/P60 protein n=1 Tax=Methylocella silvestris (strain DSM 15510 / CIP 108128 / LMG 27833 / NCIMB 13906 / BL2) TaxID=395965 RepID=B8ENG5_METSB|nr:NlpC/P60 family protein [Methylocella silvestris]ACK50096.1 NLP/P60 protein [Methylocella silvestris BL2]